MKYVRPFTVALISLALPLAAQMVVSTKAGLINLSQGDVTASG
jgi:hypothetical protein